MILSKKKERKKGRRFLSKENILEVDQLVVSVRKGRISGIVDRPRAVSISQPSYLSLEISRTCGCQVENINSNKSGLRSVVAYIAKVGLIPLAVGSKGCFVSSIAVGALMGGQLLESAMK